ncbi:MAG: ATP-binding protein [Verrucomicrobia bacterium]|nr:ATP-binding protein [Verrucomicrobiota bacterium]
MNATLLKRLFRAIHSGSGQDVETLCRRIVDEEKKLGHERVAEDLGLILNKVSGSKSERQPASSTQAGALAPLPTSRRDSAPLFHEVTLGGLRHDMVLPPAVESRFQRIEKELAARSRLATFGLKPRQRILLYGPPGCGKSLGAERLAWNTGLNLLKVRFDTLLSSYFGETLTNLRRVFDAAAAAPCALFLDECDTLARSRTERNDVGEVNRITNALLEMLENYQGQGLVIAATNLDSSLDSALFRRFDEVLKIPLPAISEIYRLLTTTMAALPTEKSIKWKEVARDMDGMSCSEVVQVGQNAAKHSVLEGRKTISAEDIRFALDEIHERLHQAP